MQLCKWLARAAILAILLLTPAATRADVRPHALISNGMVLQQAQEANIWGLADAGERVAVEFRGQKVETTAGADGKWQVRIATKEAGGPFRMVIAGRNKIVLDNVLVGEVWLASGQSNMGWPLATRPGSKELAGTDNPSIRLFTVPPKMSDAPQSELAARWEECGPATLVNFSAVAYYFGRQIQASQRVPVGLIHASYGGSGIQTWLPAEALANDPELAGLREKAGRRAEDNAQKRARLQPEIERYEAALAAAKKNGTPLPTPPRGMLPASNRHSRLYNGMIAPLVPYGMRGVIWYQGEADVERAGDYANLLSTLIRSWRGQWGQGDFPFLFVQIAPFGKIVDRPQASRSAELREAQLRISHTIPRTGMAVITDWGHETDIHVKQKEPVGDRLARLALAMVYGQRVAYSGPRYAGMQVAGNEAALTFTDVGTGLVARRMVLENVVKDPRTGQTGGALHVATGESGSAPVALTGFAVAGADQKFFPAKAEIRGATVVVSSPQVAEPVAVRYGWANYPTGNLVNSDGLPASPFRTDDWTLAVE